MAKVYFFFVFALSIINIINVNAEESYAVAGIVYEKGSNEVVIGATVMLLTDTTLLSKPLKGAYTNKYGFYSLPKINSGQYFLYVKMVGYQPYIDSINIADQSITKNIFISTQAIRVGDIEVVANKDIAETKTISTVNIDPSFIAKMPAIGGEVDVFRTLQLLPGISSSSEISSGLYIRGGSPDQNLILLDGVVVYNPSHLGGFLSAFNNDALRNVKLIKGAFPAEYGGRLSSVIDLTMKEGTAEKISGTGGFGLLTSRLTVEGPINEDATFMVSGRRFYLDLLLPFVQESSDESLDYYFYDLNAKVNYKLGQSDRLFVSAYLGRDILASLDRRSSQNENDNFNIFWGNRTANLRWLHIVNPTLFTNFSAIYTDYNFETVLGMPNSIDYFSSNSRVQDFAFKAEAQYFPDDNHLIKSGAELIFHEFSAINKSGIGNEELNALFGNESRNAIEASLYLQDEWKISDDFNANLGLRLFYFDQGNYFFPEPRLSAEYDLGDGYRLRAAGAVAHQFLHLIVRNDVNLPTDLWFPSTDKVEPSRSLQAVLGIEKVFLEGEYLFSAEVYWKDMRNLYEYKDNVVFSFGLPNENHFTKGRGEAYGLELFLNKRIGDFTGWIGYTWSRTLRYFDELNDGKPFYPRYDRRHDISIAIAYNLSENWELGATWVYATGNAFTMPAATYMTPRLNSTSGSWFNDNFYYTERNGFRLPAFHKLDLNFIYKFKWFDLPWQFSMNVYNAYNRSNPFAWYVDNEYDSSTGENTKKVKQITLFPFIPSFSLSFKF